MEEQSFTNPDKKLNTKGCCFLCLKVLTDSITDNKTKTKEAFDTLKQSVSLNILRRHLKIKSAFIKSSPINSVNKNKNEDNNIEVDLCQSCAKITKNFSRLFLLLEKIQIEMDYWLERIHQQISEAFENTELVQEYSNLMTSDEDALAQLVIVDDLRKEIAKKSSRRRTGLKPRLKALRIETIQKYLDKRQTNEFVHPSHHPNNGNLEEQQLEIDKTNANNDNSSYPEVEAKIEVALEEDESESSFLQDLDSPISALAPTYSPIPIDPPSTDKKHNKTLNVLIPTSGMYLRNPETKTFDCILCKKQLKSSKGARIHYETSHLGIIRKCQLCKAFYKSKHRLSEHQKNCDGKNRTRPPPPPIPRRAEVKKENAIPQDSTIKNSINPSTSTFSTLFSVNPNSRSIEINNMSRPPPTSGIYLENPETKTFDCISCKKQLKSRKGARIHYERVHLGKTSKCEYCEKKLTNTYKLVLHQKRCEVKIKFQNSTDPQSGPLKNRIIFDPQKEMHNCSACDKIFVTYSGAHMHFKSVHLRQKFKCDICHLAAYSQNGPLQRHKEICRQTLKKRLARRTNPDFEFVCTIPTCKKRFATNRQLRRHNNLVHLNVRKYKCDLCPKTFKVCTHLHRHKNAVHFGVKMKCKLCKKEFSYESNYRIHQKECWKNKIETIKIERKD